jgi:hypothetical protein
MYYYQDMFIDPFWRFIEEPWRHLRLYRLKNQSIGALDAIKDLPNEEKEFRANLIVYSLVQAEEYLNAASAVSLTTQPLLVSYSLLALSRCMIALRLPGDQQMFNCLQSHGAKFTVGNSLLDCTLTFKKEGIIPRLLHAANDLPLYGKTISFGDLLSMLPQLHCEYEVTYDLKSRVIPGNRENLMEYLSFKTDGNQLEECEQLISIFDSKLKNETPAVSDYDVRLSKRNGLLYATGKAMPYLKKYKIIQEYKGIWYLSLGYNLDEHDRIWISQCSLIYTLCFALGMLVRYHPILWDRLTGQASAEDRPVAERLMKTATEEFPRITLYAFFKTNESEL